MIALRPEAYVKKKRNIFEEVMSGIENMSQQLKGKAVLVSHKAQKLKKTKPSKNLIKTYYANLPTKKR